MNVGERDELIFKIIMIDYRDNDKTLFGNPVESVGFLETEYSSLPNDFTVERLRSLDDNRLSEFAKSLGINKAPTKAKSDIYINGIGYSVKSLAKSPAALVNHTRRSGFERACELTETSIEIWDELVDKYWNLRETGVIGEDVKTNNPNCPFALYKNELKPVLEYFLFTGTGSGLSKAPAEYLIEFDNPFEENTYRLLGKDDAVEEIWPKLVFSLRAKKGMPKDYSPDTYNGTDAVSIKKWVRYTSGDYRGALHIRVTR